MAEKSDLRNFGWLMAGAWMVLGGIALYRGRLRAATIAFVVSVIFLAFAILYPRALGPVYRVWMNFSRFLAWVNTRVVLSLLFYVVVTPVSLIFKLFRRDALALKINRRQSTYWHKRDRSKRAGDRYEHLY